MAATRRKDKEKEPVTLDEAMAAENSQIFTLPHRRYPLTVEVDSAIVGFVIEVQKYFRLPWNEGAEKIIDLLEVTIIDLGVEDYEEAYIRCHLRSISQNKLFRYVYLFINGRWATDEELDEFRGTGEGKAQEAPETVEESTGVS